MDSNEQFDLYLSGTLRPGAEESATLAQLSQLFKRPAESLRPLLGGKPYCIKRQLPRAEVLRYKKSIEAAGAGTLIRRSEGELPAVQTPPPSPAEPIAETVPKTGESKPSSSPAPAASPETTASALPSGIGLCPQGTPVLREEERPQPVESSVTSTAAELAPVGSLMDIADKAAPPPMPPLDHLHLANLGEDMNPDHHTAPALDLDNLTEGLSLAETGSLMDEQPEKPPVAPPDTDHIQLSR